MNMVEGESSKSGVSMKTAVAVVLSILMPVLLFAADAQNGYKVTYDGGSLGDVKAGSGIKLVINSSTITFVKDKQALLSIPSASVTEISYGQDVHRRVGTAVAVGVFTLGAGALVALSKSKKHFVGLTWANGDQRGGLAVQCDKNDYRGILAALEGVTGKKAVDSTTLSVKN